MTTSNISEEVVAMLAKQLHKNPADLRSDLRIKEDLRADSLDVVELIMSIEDKYGITVDDSAIAEIKTVGDLVAFVNKLNK